MARYVGRHAASSSRYHRSATFARDGIKSTVSAALVGNVSIASIPAGHDIALSTPIDALTATIDALATNIAVYDDNNTKQRHQQRQGSHGGATQQQCQPVSRFRAQHRALFGERL
jgi:hypothetical protein